jgi:hypothetical protein
MRLVVEFGHCNPFEFLATDVLLLGRLDVQQMVEQRRMPSAISGEVVTGRVCTGLSRTACLGQRVEK